MSATDKALHDKSLKTLADNQRWLTEHREQTVRTGDVPASDQPSEMPDRRDNLEQ